MKTTICPKCRNLVPPWLYWSSTCWYCGYSDASKGSGKSAGAHERRARAADWKRIGLAIVLGAILALLLSSCANAEPADRVDAATLARECRDGGCGWLGRTVVANGRAVRLHLDSWPQYVLFDGGLVCRMDLGSATEAAAVRDWKAVSVAGVVQVDRKSVVLENCRVHVPDAAN